MSEAEAVNSNNTEATENSQNDSKATKTKKSPRYTTIDRAREESEALTKDLGPEIEGRRRTRSAAKGVTATPPPPAKKERKSSAGSTPGRPRGRGRKKNASNEEDSQSNSKEATSTENDESKNNIEEKDEQVENDVDADEKPESKEEKAEEPKNNRSLAVFDFDHTVVKDNSDVVVQKLIQSVPDEVQELYKKEGWTKFMQGIFNCFHKQGITIADITEKIISLKPVDGMPELMKQLKNELNYDLIILSDSNKYFIDSWLKSRDLEDCVFKIYTNPIKIEDGKLNISMYHEQYDCKLSSINLCKGKIFQDFLQQRRNDDVVYDKIIYCGDGWNDLCPILRLNENNVAFIRKGYKLHKLFERKESNLVFNNYKKMIKAKVEYFDTGYDISKYLGEHYL